jgi:hypothetical protein
MTIPGSGDRRQRSATELVVRVLATAAVWTVAGGIGLRLRHPIFTGALTALAVALTVLIWLQPVRKES